MINLMFYYFKIICLTQSFMVIFNCVMADDMMPSEQALMSLKLDYQIKLERLFQARITNNTIGSNAKTSFNQELILPELTGTLIMGGYKLAWIKTNAGLNYQLSIGQKVPGLGLIISGINTESVELVDESRCNNHVRCEQIINISMR